MGYWAGMRLGEVCSVPGKHFFSSQSGTNLFLMQLFRFFGLFRQVQEKSSQVEFTGEVHRATQ